MKIKSIKVGLYQTNCYILEFEDHNILIDPGSRPQKILAHLHDKKVSAILLTHGHFDHIGAVDDLYEVYKCAIYIHHQDALMIKNASLNCSYKYNITVNSPTIIVKEGQIDVNGVTFTVYHTPGHTKGSVCYQIDDKLFTGDTIFKNSVGRTDLPTGNASDLKHSLSFIKTLSEDIMLYPGHDDKTSIKEEIINNIFLKRA